MYYIRLAINQFFKKASANYMLPKDISILMLFLFPNMKSKLFFSFLFCTSISFSYSQNLDSLLTVARTQKNDSVKIRMLNKIGFRYIFNDSDKAIAVIKEGKQLAIDKNFSFGLAELTNTHGVFMAVNGKSDSANYYYTKALKLSKANNFKSIEVMCINNLGMFNWNLGKFDEALRYFFNALKLNDTDGDERQSQIYLNNIGLIYQEMNFSEKALEYHEKALKIRKKYNLESDQVASYNNIGINLKDLGRVDEAIENYNKGLIVAKRSNNLLDYYRLLDNLANAYNVKGDLNLALKTYLKALDKPEGLDIDKEGLISTYSNITSLYNQMNNPRIALSYANKGFDLIAKLPQIEAISADLNLHTAESHYMLGDFKKAREHTKKFVALKDSIFSEKNAQAIADLEIKYETEKKEREILIQRAELAEQELTIQQKNYQLYGLIGLALIFGLIGYLFYNQQKLKNKQLQKENELKDALIKIETQNRLQEQRLRISRDLHDNIGAQLTFIISSIDNLKYGFDIKDQKLNTKLNKISAFTSETIYELRDTIWAMNKNEISFEDLQSRISNYIDKAHLYDGNIAFSFDVDSSVNQQKTLSSIEGMNIHRIIQEAIHNSLKHASATEIKVRVAQLKEHLKITISDNGNGFHIPTVEKGSGLTNMNKRAKHIGGELAIVSEPNKGTQIILKV
ncbi:tetratricopeptide repeat-containing sensor histidine kinase [Psychroserpens sp.]|uniref:tetratricopeptide repeat-containing sensor histidine kinase n=1 Tax=Psychroserpens sp. TaxID=2020870 RepID=UPI002B2714E5|nr:tetratricopeptide repeat protein [Psychroserpens sp.]